MRTISEDRLRGYIARCREMSEDGKFTWWSELADIIESLALRAPPSGEAGEVKVKALEWEAETRACKAHVPFGYYAVEDMGSWRDDDRYWLQFDRTISKHGSEADAKAAAQADYETRIRSALLPTIKEPTDGK